MADGVLLSAHGTVEHVDELPEFLRRIRRGRPASAELVEEVTRRYTLIGGSPLLRTTREVARALEAELGVPVAVGMRLFRPEIEDGLAELRARGVTRVISLPLAPQSVHVYDAAVVEKAAGLEVVAAGPWGDEPLLLDAFSSSIDEAIAKLSDASRATAPLVLSAHSLPTRAIAAGDPYEAQFRAMCGALLARRGDGRASHICFQSQGMDGGDWLGPDLPTTLRAVADAGHTEVVVAAVGFLADHVETLYDLDIEALEIAKGMGLRLVRARCLDADPMLIRALAAVATRAMAH